jgi:subtilase family serine protease
MLKARAVQVVEALSQGVPLASGPSLVGADRLHDEGITGAGVTVAILDTVWSNVLNSEILRNSSRSLN